MILILLLKCLESFITITVAVFRMVYAMVNTTTNTSDQDQVPQGEMNNYMYSFPSLRKTYNTL